MPAPNCALTVALPNSLFARDLPITRSAKALPGLLLLDLEGLVKRLLRELKPLLRGLKRLLEGLLEELLEGVWKELSGPEDL